MHRTEMAIVHPEVPTLKTVFVSWTSPPSLCIFTSFQKLLIFFPCWDGPGMWNRHLHRPRRELALDPIECPYSLPKRRRIRLSYVDEAHAGTSLSCPWNFPSESFAPSSSGFAMTVVLDCPGRYLCLCSWAGGGGLGGAYIRGSRPLRPCIPMP